MSNSYDSCGNVSKEHTWRWELAYRNAECPTRPSSLAEYPTNTEDWKAYEKIYHQSDAWFSKIGWKHPISVLDDIRRAQFTTPSPPRSLQKPLLQTSTIQSNPNSSSLNPKLSSTAIPAKPQLPSPRPSTLSPPQQPPRIEISSNASSIRSHAPPENNVAVHPIKGVDQQETCPVSSWPDQKCSSSVPSVPFVKTMLEDRAKAVAAFYEMETSQNVYLSPYLTETARSDTTIVYSSPIGVLAVPNDAVSERKMLICLYFFDTFRDPSKASIAALAKYIDETPQQCMSTVLSYCDTRACENAIKGGISPYSHPFERADFIGKSNWLEKIKDVFSQGLQDVEQRGIRAQKPENIPEDIKSAFLFGNAATDFMAGVVLHVSILCCKKNLTKSQVLLGSLTYFVYQGAIASFMLFGNTLWQSVIEAIEAKEPTPISQAVNSTASWLYDYVLSPAYTILIFLRDLPMLAFRHVINFVWKMIFSEKHPIIYQTLAEFGVMATLAIIILYCGAAAGFYTLVQMLFRSSSNIPWKKIGIFLSSFFVKMIVNNMLTFLFFPWINVIQEDIYMAQTIGESTIVYWMLFFVIRLFIKSVSEMVLLVLNKALSKGRDAAMFLYKNRKMTEAEASKMASELVSALENKGALLKQQKDVSSSDSLASDDDDEEFFEPETEVSYATVPETQQISTETESQQMIDALKKQIKQEIQHATQQILQDKSWLGDSSSKLPSESATFILLLYTNNYVEIKSKVANETYRSIIANLKTELSRNPPPKETFDTRASQQTFLNFIQPRYETRFRVEKKTVGGVDCIVLYLLPPKKQARLPEGIFERRPVPPVTRSQTSAARQVQQVCAALKTKIDTLIRTIENSRFSFKIVSGQ